MQKATHLSEIAGALNKFEPVPPDHPFYVDFSGLRGSFAIDRLYKMLNVRKVNKNGETFWEHTPLGAKTFIFLAGMRGSGKTTELLRYARELEGPSAFLCVVCNVDGDLDMPDLEYMDVLIYQLEKLIERVGEKNVQLDEDIVEAMQTWFANQVEEINKRLRAEGEIEISAGNKEGYSLWKLLLSTVLGIRTTLSGSLDRATHVRKVMRNNFSDFATRFNEFIEKTVLLLQKRKIAKDILFIVDGLEKTMTAEVRKRMVIDGANQIRSIKVHTIFTLPVELTAEANRIKNFAEILIFPFIKVQTRDGQDVPESVNRFLEFIDRRISAELFASEEVKRKAILLSGGSPRQLLRILEHASWEVAEGACIDEEALQKAVEYLSNEMARFIREEQFEELRKIEEARKSGIFVPFNDCMQDLMEQEIVFEYDDGTYKDVNPLVAASKAYKTHVLQ